MQKCKKILCIMVASLLILTVLGGCQAGENGVDATTTANSTAADTCLEPAAATNLEPYEINWYTIADPQQDTPLVEEEVNKYLKDKINATLKLNYLSWGDFDAKIPTMLMAGESFDLCFTCGWFNKYRPNVAKGVFLGLSKLIDEYAPKTKALLGEDILSATRIVGQNYAIPTYKEMARAQGYLLLNDLVEKYKFDLSTIKTYKDIEPMLKVIKENEPDIVPHGNDTPMEWNSLCDTIVLYPDNRDTKAVFFFETPEFKDICETAYKWAQAGYISKDKGITQEDMMKNSKVFAVAQGLKPGKDAEISKSYKNKWVQVQTTPTIMTNGELDGSMVGIPINSKNPERAMMLLELYNTDKYLNNLISFGIENTHWVKVSDNIIDFAPATENGAKSGYNPNTSWTMGNIFLNYVFKSEDPNKLKNLEDFNKTALAMNNLGFSLDSEPIKTEQAACANVYSEYYEDLKRGLVDPAVKIPEAIEKFEANGIRKIQEEVQKQLDRYMASKK